MKFAIMFETSPRRDGMDERAIGFYRAAGCEDHIRFLVWDGGHTVPSGNECYDFLFEGMRR